MKKLTLFLLFLFACCIVSFGKAVSVSTAKTVGYNYLLQHGGATLNSATDLNLVYTSGKSTALFYVFSGNNCFVIVSAEDGVIPIIGYSTNRPFHGNSIPKTVISFFENYNKQIDYVQKNNIIATPEIDTNWNNLINNKRSRNTARTTIVTPLLTTTWNQSPYYNADCPYDVAGGGLSVTGCVATATAQVMKFWNWPTTGVGFHSYTTTSYGTLSANFGSTTYGWPSMPNNVTSSNPSVATLMYHVGVSINMNYSATESSAYVISSITGTPPYCAEYALKTYFDYAPTLHGEPRSSYSDATWISMLESDLTAGRPIIYSGTGSAGGHCFVFDGFDASSDFHVNWGWGGVGPDGYFTIDALNPPALGTGGGGGGFNNDQTAIFGVQPNVPPTASLKLYNYVTPTPSTIFYDNAFSIFISIENVGTGTFTGTYCAAAFDSAGTFRGYVDSLIVSSLPTGYYDTGTISTTGLLSMLPGKYTIGIFYRNAGGSWIAVPNNGSYINFQTITVVNHNYIELYSAMTPSPSVFVQGSPASVNLNLINNGTDTFSGDYMVSLYNLDGSFNSTIQTLTTGSNPLPPTYTYGSPYLTFTTSAITAAPGTYLLATEFQSSTPPLTWYLAGADYFENPIYVTVVAPALSPDIYEVNNTEPTAYNLTSTLTWVSNVSHTGTPGSNFHVVTDQDYYSIVLSAGYNYSITARINDIISTDDGLSYTADAVWSYSTNGGSTWSTVYDDVMPGTINLTGYTGGTVIFHVSPHYAGITGTYLLQISNITRTPAPTTISQINLSEAKIFPNPASDFITIDFSGIDAKGITAMLKDVVGKTVFSADVTGQSIITIPVSSLVAGTYILEVSTDAGLLTKKITVLR